VPAAIGVVSFTLLLALALFVLGGRAQNAANARPMPNVVGMRVAEARRVLQAKGPVKIRVVRVSYGRAGEVQRVSGFEFDGTYNKATTLVLSVGSRDPNR
jgi:beta-lactam-binding protein with PASTA domain